jgi:diaminopimelate decarboxylase
VTPARRNVGPPARRPVDPASFTPFFAWRRAASRGSSARRLFCEGVSLARVADSVGTPVYLYSRASIQAAFREFDRALRRPPHTICYAVKANGNLSLLRLLARLGSGFDIVSGGELDRLGRIGVPGKRIVFSGVGKTREEIREALRYRPQGPARGEAGILLFHVESEAELELLAEEASRVVVGRGLRPSVSVRVNPDVAAGGHPHISTGRHQHKFGLDWPQARRLYLAHRGSRWFDWRGIGAHIGSQITGLAPFCRALQRLASHYRELMREGLPLRYLDVGGGLGIHYTDETPPSRPAYARAVARLAHPLGCHLLLEPGRSIVGPAGILLTRVLYTKQNRGKRFVIVDAAMNDLIRPALYGAVHPITPLSKEGNSSYAKQMPVDIVGPVCETGDAFLHAWPLEPVEPGDVLAIWGAGAYGFALASNYNVRPRPAEVLVEGKRFRIIRRRETRDDLVGPELLD